MDREEFLEIYYKAVELGWFERRGYNGYESVIEIPKGCASTVEIRGDIRDILHNGSDCGDEEIFCELMEGMTVEEWACERFDAGTVIGICPRRWMTYNVDFENDSYDFVEHGDDTVSGTEFYIVKYNTTPNPNGGYNHSITLEYLC